MIELLIPALCAVRWDAGPEGELPRRVAALLLDHLRARAVAIRIAEPRALLVTAAPGGPIFAEVEPMDTTARSERRRPRAGWGEGAADRTAADVAAARYVTIPLQCRHAEASVVVWLGRSRRGHDTLPPERGDVLASVLGLIADAHVLVHRVAKLSRDAHSHNRRLREDLRHTLGADEVTRSPLMRHCFDRANAVAAFETPVLITGPSGAGKELIARRVHARSAHARGAFVKVNCGAIPEALAPSELFGHERGAFTGAVAEHRGVFARAAGGTLLLDEVGELAPSTQAKLLRVLQEGTFTPVGSELEQRSDARIIAATHRDLATRVAEGAFREDLYYRLAVFEVAVPSLSERVEDLPRLVRQILDRTAARLGRAVPNVPPAVMRALAAHDWPGNVRELQNVLEGALVMSGRRLEIAPLGSATASRRPSPHAPRTLDAAVRETIEAALRVSGGKLYGAGGAAEALGLPAGTLQSKMRKLGIDRKRFVTAR